MPELSPEHWQEVERLFDLALDLPGAERPDFLTRECLDDRVRREVVSLLAHAGGARLAAIEESIAFMAADLAEEVNPDERMIGARLGPYRLVEIAGHGGMGAVYRALRDDGEFRQQVAIKLVRAAAESSDTQQKFRRERQILARLSHPNIARLLDGGSTSEGVPYLVMEFIEGEPITAWCESHALSTADRLRIFLPVCEGVEAANREMVIHRDLKPANILVTKDGVPKLLDFGIAKLLDAEGRDTASTATRFQAMTPDYAAPEQVRGEAVTSATDVYALGVVLYELLTGMKAQQIPESTLKPQLSRDLDNIIRMAIRKEPARRYQTAAGFADDIRRYLAGQPVAARPDTFAYRTTKFLSRHRIGVRATAVSGACVIAGLAWWRWVGETSRSPRLLQVLQLTQAARINIDARIATDGSRLYFTEQNEVGSSISQVSVNGGTPSPIPLPAPLTSAKILDISPDGNSLLVAAGLESEYAQPAWIVPKTGGSARRLGDVSSWFAAWSRDGRGIFFVRGAALYRVNIDGTDIRKIIDLPDGSYDLRAGPGQHPDVLRLSEFKRDMLSSNIWQLGVDGADFHAVLPGNQTGTGWPDGFYSGDWMSFGRYYLLRSRQAGISSFMAVRESGGAPVASDRPVTIYTTPLKTRSFTPSLDGKRIFFAAAQSRADLVRYDPVRGQFLPFIRGLVANYVSVSQDQRKVVYTSVPHDTLWKCLADGSGRVQMTPPDMRVFRPRWSPDGTVLAFTGGKSGQPVRAYVIPSGGGTPEAIDPAPFETNPSWSPKGNLVLVTRTVNKGASGTPGLYAVDWRTHRAELLPGSEALASGEWSPDERFVAAIRTSADVMLFDVNTKQWSVLAHGSGIGALFWSRDSKYVFFQDQSGVKAQPVFRVRIGDGKMERLMTSSQIPQSDVTGYSLMGLAPDNSPFALVERSNSDIYALDLDLP